MADLHIEDFYRDTAKILSQLYAVFPRRENLYVDDICGPDAPDEFGLPSPRYQACFSAMLWLGEQGYLRYTTTIRQEALDQAVLTQKSLLLLSSRSTLAEEETSGADGQTSPSVAADAMTNIAQLRRALGSGSSIQLQQTVHHLLSCAAQFE